MQYIVAIYTGTKRYSVEKESDESSISDENGKVYADWCNKYWEEICSKHCKLFIKQTLYKNYRNDSVWKMIQEKIITTIHIFGSKIYAHVPKKLRRKLDEKAKIYVLGLYRECKKISTWIQIQIK